MKILFIGDIVGRKGREKVKELVPSIREQYAIDYTIANAENSAHGKGVTKKIYNDLRSHGVDFITLGNHAFDNNEVCTLLKNKTYALLCHILIKRQRRVLCRKKR